jgi:hypothetical protein
VRIDVRGTLLFPQTITCIPQTTAISELVGGYAVYTDGIWGSNVHDAPVLS